jgi:hypothetical protein
MPSLVIRSDDFIRAYRLPDSDTDWTDDDMGGVERAYQLAGLDDLRAHCRGAHNAGEPATDGAWLIGPVDVDPVRLRVLIDRSPFGSDDYADETVRFVRETDDGAAPGGIATETVAEVSYRIDGRA